MPAFHRHRPDEGTVLLLCLAIVITLTVLTYGFLRVTQLGYGAGDSMNRQLLAKEATLTGANHAYEQIMRDYVNEPITRLDGPAQAPFVSLNQPYAIDTRANTPYIEQTLPGYPTTIGYNDGAFERLTYGPIFQEYWTAYTGDSLPFEGGLATYDGRGRYYEPNFYNLAATAPAIAAAPPYLALAAPTVPVPFQTAYSATAAVPDRNGAIYYDEHWHRLPDPPLVARVKARYRLRYNVGVIDLCGNLCLDGDPALDYRYINQADPTALTSPAPLVMGDPGTPVPTLPSLAEAQRMVRSQHAVVPMMSALGDYAVRPGPFENMAAAERAQHVFINRGYSSNFDQRNTTGAPSWTPVTFPDMYRQPYMSQLYEWASGGYPPPPTYPPTALYCDDGAHGGTVVGGNPAGGEPIHSGNNYTMRRALVGPQYTFVGIDWSTLGNAPEWGGDSGELNPTGAISPFGRGLNVNDADPKYAGQSGADTPFVVNLMTAPPQVVFAMVTAYMPPGAMINIWHNKGATAGGPNVVPNLGFYSATPSGAGAGGNNPPGSIPAGPAYTASATDCLCAPLYGTRDLFVPQLSAAFGPGYGNYSSPTRTTPNGPVAPDYHMQAQSPPIPPAPATGPATAGDLHPSNAAFRAPATRYPGPLAYNGYDTAPTGGEIFRYDSLGMYLRALNGGTSVAPLPQKVEYMTTPNQINAWGAWGANANFDPQSAQPYGNTAVPFWADMTLSRSGKIAASDANWYLTWADVTPGSTRFDEGMVMPFPTSIWEVIGQAMGDTAMVARAMWQQYPSYSNPNPQTLFNGGPWTGSFPASGGLGPHPLVMNLQDLDTLFLANLGIDINNPSGPPVTAWAGSNAVQPATIQSFTPAWNLASLRAAPFFDLNVDPAQAGYDATQPHYTALQRTQAMEMIINDFRLSFFGCNPAYPAFKLLDLNGDGQVNSSSFPSSGIASEMALHIDQHVGGASASPQVWFSNTGVFTIGKSRYWRVFSRGEVWDNLLNKPVSEALMDSVLCVDPAGAANELGSPGQQHPNAGQYADHVLYQRWWYDKYRGHLSRRY
jgi:hypothetical protein